MNLDESGLWERISSLAGSTVHTLAQQKPNLITSVSKSEVIIKGRETRPCKADLYNLYTILESGETIVSDDIQWLKEKRVSRICVAILAQAVPDEIEVASVGRKVGIRRRFYG